MRALSLDRVTRHEAYSASGKRLMMLMPSELTRLRMERLVTDYFAGREELFITMFDKFFQANMGELSSKNNDLVSGDVTLYPFPNNGFSSMVTTGAKGSKVNFAMICGMLSQQSLEGKRVPLMISGKTHPAFGRWDLGARAGGLITDRYLTGLRPPDYFFHCMAGREGLVDTAVKTARSGYLQRCVIKSLEGMIVSYDGSVREGDGSIVQFLYGEDGADVCRMTYLHNLKDLLANPAVVQAKFASEEKLDSDVLKQRLGALETALKSRAKAQTAHREDDYDPHFNTPLTAKFPPLLYPGSVSEWFEQAAETQVAKAVEDQRIREPLVKQGLLRSKDLKHKSYFAKPDGSMTALGRVLRLKYRQALAEPGDAVGCLAAQSMGEPATQMTLNTFHLAGHGAANVTLGIPRLREILQTAGAASTPVLYLPVRGDDQETRSANCQKLLLGFRKIMLTDVINAVGVEANVYAQPFRNGAVGGCSEFETAYARHEPRYGDGLLRKYWGYECTIQFENLEHFCKVVPKYTPQKLVNFTINRVVKELLKTVNKLMAIYSTKASEEMWDSDEDELSLAAEKFIFERNLRTIQDKKKALKETFRAAGIGFGAAAGNDRDGGESAVDLDLLAAGDTGTIYRKGARKLRGDDVEEADDEMGDAEFDTDISNDDSEDDLTDPNGSDGEILDDEEEPAPETTADAEQSAAEQSGAEQTAADEDMEDEVLTEEERKRLRREEKRRLKRMAKLDDIEPDRLEEEALWSEGEGAGFRSKHLPPEASRYLESIKVCRKTWRIVIKWGWPVERCPRRIEFMPSLTRIITKQVLQNTPGVANPHVVTKQDTHTKGVDCEVQCEGSNLEWVSQLSSQCVDHTRIGTNDIRSIFRFYGVEAGRASIIRELASVFGVYGITVDFRHLSLIADAMTHSGEFRAFSRLGMSHHPSPLLQMSFETSIKFLTEGVERGAIDNLRCPSGAIVVGRNTNVGTGLSRPLTRLPAQIRI
ncbi:DNA-directed RNA polymerase [Gregarina niphandrodes]|uniref:DNA-directed RNA polymerase n=1 Tax=Gregarina niphandrodes TaxID=110365 RepID=A0A023BCU8_GRENI|nr:DNA-directed RNA polymerase [Gregarina niphandrodes]EZG84057.1 DNA-directed RNA polymerase [Gregarina niphandrodes]|eukprot:XP_011128875.1 DNA-directed RNA polymerase [Gregarina niphandrodes]